MEAAGEDTGIESASDRVIGGEARRSGTREYFTLGVVNEGFVMALLPKIHTLCKAQTYVFGAANSWCGLEDCSYKDKGTLGVPMTRPNATKFVGKEG